MKNSILTGFVSIVVLSGYSLGAPQQWTLRDNPINGRVVGLSAQRFRWNQAEAAAVSMSGHLITIRSQAEQDWLINNFSAIWFSGYNPGPNTPIGPWIGLSDNAVEGFFAWSSGESPTYSNWESGQPNNGVGTTPPVDHDYVAMSASGLWFDTTEGGGNYDNVPLRALVEFPVRPLQSWSFNAQQQLGMGSQYHKVSVSDINGDGQKDAVCAAGSAIQILLGNGQGVFNAPTSSLRISGGIASFYNVRVGDIDLDGDQDIVSTDLNGYLHVAEQTAPSTFHPNSTVVASLPWAKGLELSDLDRDGDLEIIASTGFGGGTDFVAVYSRDALSGVWSRTQTLGPWPVVTESINALKAFDMDGDGNVDIAASCGVPGVVLLRGSTNGQLQFLGTLGAGRAGSLDCGDIDRDGDDDMVLAYPELSQIQVFSNLGGGAFAPLSPLPCGATPEEVAVADFSGDARADIVVACNGSNRVDAFLALSTGGFEVRPSFTGFATPTWTGLADINNDGKKDMLTVSSTSQLVWVLNQFVYDCNGNGVEDELDVAAGSSDCNGNLRPDTCDIQFGSPDCNSNGQLDSCDLVVGSRDLNGDLVPDECQPVGVVVCAGDGTAANCPCGNFGGVGRGCGNAGNSGGAALTAIGSARVSHDTVMLLSNGTAPSAVGLFIQGTIAANGSLGVPFGDGLRCAAGSVLRLNIAAASGGFAQFPTVNGPELSVVGQIPTAGATRVYQLWYRDSAPYCSASTFNLTNGLRVVWAP